MPHRRLLHRAIVWFVLATALAGSELLTIVMGQSIALTPVSIESVPLQRAIACSGRFVAHHLEHATHTADGVVRMFEANGSGLAVNDLDNDGDLDLLLGNHAGPNSIFWNQGGLTFRKESWGEGLTRAITVVDLNQDGWRDIVLTRNTGVLNYWRNSGAGGFVQEVLPGIAIPAYALAWGDVDHDSDLDLVTASYDAGILTDVGANFLLSGGGGVVYYEQRAGRFLPTRLSTAAQGLALLLADINEDGYLDILVGNDFAMPDQLWLGGPAASWTPAQPFAQSSQSTMSIDWGDITNRGGLAIFTADMNPYDTSVSTLSAWLPVMATLQETNAHDDPQQLANALQMRGATGNWRNEAPRRGVDASGWSWASKFGDLDNDGYLDLYVVNGMIEERMFGHLPNHELVEENQTFRNVGDGYFVPMPAWGLNSKLSGRSLVLADLDSDGDLDGVVNNLRGPAQLWENQLCSGNGLAVELIWPTVQNRDGLGAVVTLQTTRGAYRRDVRAASGYLGGDAPRLHFGLPVEAQVQTIHVRWPDGARSVVEGGSVGALVQITRR
jgi:hypothetical protein